MKKYFINIILIFVLLYLLLLPNYSLAASDDFSWGSIENTAKEFFYNGQKNKKDIQSDDMVNSIANVLTTIGVVII